MLFSDEAEKLAAQTAVAEAQARINARFAQLLLTNNSCQDALNKIKELTALADSSEGGAKFGDFVLTPPMLSTHEGDTVMSAQRGEGSVLADVGTLRLPTCQSSGTRQPSDDADVAMDEGTVGMSQAARWMVGQFFSNPKNATSDGRKTLDNLGVGEQLNSKNPNTAFFSDFDSSYGHAVTKLSEGVYEILTVSNQNPDKGIIVKVDSSGQTVSGSERTVSVDFVDGKWVY